MLLSAPVSHFSGVFMYTPDTDGHGEGYSLWQPMKGGFRFVLVQGLGWSIYAATLVSTLNPCWRPGLPFRVA